MQNKPRICALMLAYFKADMTHQCLKTLENQGISKLVLIDNSADPSENQRTLKLVEEFPEGWLNVVISPENLGFAKGMNLALEHARKLGEWDYFLVLNNDINAKPELVQQLHGYMDGHPDTALLGCLAGTDSNPDGGLYYQRLTGLMFKRPVIGAFQVATGYCVMVRPAAICEYLFDPRYFMYGEDVELTWRLRQQHQAVRIYPQPLLAHETAQSSGEGSLFYEYHVNRGHMLLVDALGKNNLERMLMYTLRLPLLFMRASLRSWRFRTMVPLKALLASLWSINPFTTATKHL